MVKGKGKGRTLVIAPLQAYQPPQRRSGTRRAQSSVAHTCLWMGVLDGVAIMEGLMAVFESEFGASLCNQWGLCCIVVRKCVNR